jgi:hypothetical protein
MITLLLNLDTFVVITSLLSDVFPNHKKMSTFYFIDRFQ